MKTHKVAGGGLCAALCLSLLLGASFIPAKLAFLFAASIVGAICLLRYKGLTFWLFFSAVSVLALLFIPNKLIALAYVAVFGNYPFLKLYIEKIPRLIFEYAFKILVWNLYLVAAYVIVIALGETGFFVFSLFWMWFIGLLMLLFYDLAFGIVINAFYRSYYKFLR